MLNNLPTPTETLLLQAALLPGGEALPAWQAWREAVPFEQIDYGSQRQLPLLLTNLRRLGVKDPCLAQYEGVYKLYWSRNRVLMHQLSAVLRALAARPLPAMLIKGTAFNALGLIKPGLRPMVDLDLVVPGDRAAEAIEIALGLGYSTQTWQRRMFSRTHLLFTDHGDFSRGRDITLELHWESPAQFRRGSPSRLVWANATAHEFNGVPFLVMNPADQLLHVCAHGGCWNAVASIRWVSDAMLILAHYPIDWDYFQHQARRQRLTFVTRGMLDYLRMNFSAPIPDTVISRLEETEVKVLEKWEWSTLQLDGSKQVGFFRTLGLHFCRLQRRTDGKPGVRQILGYLWHWLLQRTDELGVRGALRRFVRRLGLSLGRT